MALRPVSDGDVEFMYSIAAHGENLIRWRLRGNPISLSAFANFLWTSSDLQFIVVARHSGERLGHVGTYHPDPHGGTTYFAMLLSPDAQKQGWPMEGAVLMLNFLFTQQPLRRIYFEIPGFNDERFASFVGQHFEKEGCLREHLFAYGRYWDMTTWVLTRSRWEALAATPIVAAFLPGGR